MRMFSVQLPAEFCGFQLSKQQKQYSAGEQRYRLDQLALPAGVYYYTLRSGDYTATRSMVVVRP